MDDFGRYERLRDQGATPLALDRIGRDEGLDPVIRMRMIRSVFRLSLTEAKRAIGLEEILTLPQAVAEGAIVSWDWNQPTGTSLIRTGRVLAIDGDQVRVLVLEDCAMKTGELLPAPAEPEVVSVPLTDLSKSLIDRLEEAEQLWEVPSQDVAVAASPSSK